MPADRQTLIGRRQATHKVCHLAGSRGPACATAPDPEDGCWEAPPPAEVARQANPGFSALRRRLPAQGRTHARARTLTHVHTQQKEAVRAACGGPLGALGKAPPPGPHRTARAACSLTEAPSERPGCAERRAARPAVLGLSRGGRRRRRLWAHQRAAPRGCSAHRPAERRQKPACAAVRAGPGSRLPWLLKKWNSNSDYPHPYKPSDV